MAAVDIQNRADIVKLVDQFYQKVGTDPLLKDIFNTRLAGHWDAHLEKMYNFWETILLDNHSYIGSPFMPHASLPIEKVHFDHWISLFFITMDELYTGPKAEEAKLRAKKMSEMFQHKLAYYSQTNKKPLI